MPISYLVVHAAQNPGRTLELTEFQRASWNRLLPFEQHWIILFAPETAPAEPFKEQVTLPDRDQLPLAPSKLFPVDNPGKLH